MLSSREYVSGATHIHVHANQPSVSGNIFTVTLTGQRQGHGPKMFLFSGAPYMCAGEPGLSSQALSTQSNPGASQVADRGMTFS